MALLEFRAGNAPPNTELIKGLQRREIDVVLSAAKPRQYSPKSVMTHQRERADHFFLLWKGRARFFFETHNGRKINLVWITPGNIFGEMALLHSPSDYLVSTEAVEDSTVQQRHFTENIARSNPYEVYLSPIVRFEEKARPALPQQKEMVGTLTLVGHYRFGRILAGLRGT